MTDHYSSDKDNQLASLKSSLAEKEAELARIQRLPTLKWAEASADIMLEFASTARGGDKEAAQKMLAAFDKVKTYVNQLEAHITYRERELDRHIFSSRVCIEGRDSQLASLKQENERVQEDIAKLTSGNSIGEAYNEVLKEQRGQLAQLQLENGVMRQGLEKIVNRVNNEGDDSQATVSDCGYYAREALSTSTKSSLMEKVRNLCDAAESMRISMGMWLDFFDGHADPELCRSQHRHALKLYESALTEVKKEIGA